MLLGFRIIRGKPLFIVVGDVGCRDFERKKKLACLVGEEKKASALFLRKKKASALLPRKKSKCLFAEEKKASAKSVPDTPPQ